MSRHIIVYTGSRAKCSGLLYVCLIYRDLKNPKIEHSIVALASLESDKQKVVFKGQVTLTYPTFHDR